MSSDEQPAKDRSFGQQYFRDACEGEDPAEMIAGLCDYQLRCLLRFLAAHAIYDGIPGQIWAMALGDAAKRFTQQA